MALTISDLTRGIQPHFTNRLIELQAEDTPVFSTIKKGMPLKNPVAQQPIDDRGKISKRGVLDGDPAPTPIDSDKYRIIESLNHTVEATIVIGKKAENLVDQAGIKNQRQNLVDKKMFNMKNAADQIICDDSEMREEGTDGKGSETRGLFKWCQSTAQSVRPVDALYRTPAGQIDVASTFAAFDETKVQGLINAHYQNTGEKANIKAFCGVQLKQKYGNMTISQAEASSTTYLRRFNSPQDEKILTAMVNVLECDGGRVELFLTRNLLTDRAATDYSATADKTHHSMIGWSGDAAELRFGWEPTMEPLGKRGSSTEIMFSMNFAVCANPTRLFKFVPNGLS